jgi:hypothetical protein
MSEIKHIKLTRKDFVIDLESKHCFDGIHYGDAFIKIIPSRINGINLQGKNWRKECEAIRDEIIRKQNKLDKFINDIQNDSDGTGYSKENILGKLNIKNQHRD